jgi:hypothetical protein
LFISAPNVAVEPRESTPWHDALDAGPEIFGKVERSASAEDVKAS